MAKRNTQKQRGAAQRRPNEGLIIFAGIGFLIVASLVLFFATREGAGQPVRPAMTLDPQITVNLTEMPRATPLSGEEADSWNEFRAMVDACDDYSPERRAQMEQHIAWLLDPSDMPRDVILAIQWRLNDRPPDSCLIPIGLTLNEILEALGSNPFDIYDEVAGSS
jgi:hypothetical protein